MLQRWLPCSRSCNFEPRLSHKVMWGHSFTRLSYKIMLCCKFMLSSSLLSPFRYLFSSDFLWAAPLICPKLSHLNELFTRALDPLSRYPAVKPRVAETLTPVVSTPLSISTIASINFLTLPFNLLTPRQQPRQLLYPTHQPPLTLPSIHSLRRYHTLPRALGPSSRLRHTGLPTQRPHLHR